MSTTMSITRALAELKTLQKRIDKLTNAVFITTVIPGRGSPSSEEEMRSNWDSVNALIDRYRNIKFAILHSNSVTKVKVGTRTYSVAEAIAMKDNIKQSQNLIDSVRRQMLVVSNTVDHHNDQIQSKLDSLMEINFKERKTSEDDMRTIKEAYLKNNEIKVVDPLKLQTKVSDLETEIEEFLTNVDFCLSESNATTTITV